MYRLDFAMVCFYRIADAIVHFYFVDRSEFGTPSGCQWLGASPRLVADIYRSISSADVQLAIVGGRSQGSIFQGAILWATFRMVFAIGIVVVVLEEESHARGVRMPGPPRRFWIAT